MEVITTAGGKSTVYCGENCFQNVINCVLSKGQIFVITDSNVMEIYKNLITETFVNAPMFVIKAGEKNKNKKTLFAILQAMVENNLTRTCTVIAFGGGVVGDIAGLAASLYMRGVRIIQIPTTLLAQVDSSVGGKTAIDFCGVKNVIGSFYQPETVIIDPIFLKTLPKREIRCGLGEIVKYAALNAEIYRAVTNCKNLFDGEFLKEVIPLCIKYKTQVVDSDERETGIRKCLNLGHTTGHAFELFYKKKSHGEFVLIGMYYELFIASRCGIVGEQYKNSMIKIIKKVIHLPKYENTEAAAKASVHDKKNKTSDKISLILPKSVGEWQELNLPYNDYIELVSECAKTLNTGKTLKKFAVIGKDVSKSSSPQMHAFIANRLGFKIKYDKISIPEERFGQDIAELFKKYDGFNVTIPYKLQIIPYLKKTEGDAVSFGAVNTVTTNSLTGYNTDGLGFMLMLKNAGIEIYNKSVLLLGAGGAGRSVAKKLAETGANVYVYDKNAVNVANLAKETQVFPQEQIAIRKYDIIINATGVGMHKTEGLSPVNESLICLCDTAIDLIYVPEKSKFLQIAESNGKRILNGTAMLFYQAYFAECIFWGIQSDAIQAKTLYEEYIKENKL